MFLKVKREENRSLLSVKGYSGGNQLYALRPFVSSRCRTRDARLGGDPRVHSTTGALAISSFEIFSIYCVNQDAMGRSRGALLGEFSGQTYFQCSGSSGDELSPTVSMTNFGVG